MFCVYLSLAYVRCNLYTNKYKNLTTSFLVTINISIDFGINYTLLASYRQKIVCFNVSKLIFILAIIVRIHMVLSAYIKIFMHLKCHAFPIS